MSKRKTATFKLRCTTNDLALIKRAAKSMSATDSWFIRWSSVGAARDVLRKVRKLDKTE